MLILPFRRLFATLVPSYRLRILHSKNKSDGNWIDFRFDSVRASRKIEFGVKLSLSRVESLPAIKCNRRPEIASGLIADFPPTFPWPSGIIKMCADGQQLHQVVKNSISLEMLFFFSLFSLVSLPTSNSIPKGFVEQFFSFECFEQLTEFVEMFN